MGRRMSAIGSGPAGLLLEQAPGGWNGKNWVVCSPSGRETENGRKLSNHVFQSASVRPRSVGGLQIAELDKKVTPLENRATKVLRIILIILRVAPPF